jgi:hypothetical protein
MMWSTHSRRIDAINRSAKPFCQGEAENGLVGTLLRYRYDIRSEEEYFDEFQDVKVTNNSLCVRIASASDRARDRLGGGVPRRIPGVLKRT